MYNTQPAVNESNCTEHSHDILPKNTIKDYFNRGVNPNEYLAHLKIQSTNVESNNVRLVMSAALGTWLGHSRPDQVSP